MTRTCLFPEKKRQRFRGEPSREAHGIHQSMWYAGEHAICTTECSVRDRPRWGSLRLLPLIVCFQFACMYYAHVTPSVYHAGHACRDVYLVSRYSFNFEIDVRELASSDKHPDRQLHFHRGQGSLLVESSLFSSACTNSHWAQVSLLQRLFRGCGRLSMGKQTAAQMPVWRQAGVLAEINQGVMTSCIRSRQTSARMSGTIFAATLQRGQPLHHQ
jgi:hypothetical protein